MGLMYTYLGRKQLVQTLSKLLISKNGLFSSIGNPCWNRQVLFASSSDQLYKPESEMEEEPDVVSWTHPVSKAHVSKYMMGVSKVMNTFV